MTMSFEKGIKIILKDKDITKEDYDELERMISKFLIDKNYNGAKVHKIGHYNMQLEPVWKDCKDII